MDKIKEFNLKRLKIEVAYEKRNETIIDLLIKGKLTTRESLKELNKNLGKTLVELSDIRN